ncbi:unnamed protein product [Pedinophyceae sp. YPF-701]|nr:unnamed protein product [Pedinophyceae sp. YPF-701]
MMRAMVKGGGVAGKAQARSGVVVRAAANGSGPRPKAPSLLQAMSFNGPAPEIINARAAMIGFLAAIGSEAVAGQTVAQTAHEHPVAVGATVVAITAASLAPILQGALRSESLGPFTPKAELANGRAAMLGMVLLLCLERASGQPMF